LDIIRLIVGEQESERPQFHKRQSAGAPMAAPWVACEEISSIIASQLEASGTQNSSNETMAHKERDDRALLEASRRGSRACTRVAPDSPNAPI